MKTQKSEYDIHAESFLSNHDATMEAIYLGHYPILSEHSTSQWQIIITRHGKKPYTFTFSQSIQESWAYMDSEVRFPHKKIDGLPPRIARSCWPKRSEQYTAGPYTIYPVKKAPSAYDVLACLTKSCPGTFENFCSEYGYDEDSRKAYDLYLAVQKEWSEVNRFFQDCMYELQEIN